MTDIKWICANTMFTKVRRNWEKNRILESRQEWDKMISLVKLKSGCDQWRRIEESEFEGDEEDLQLLLS